MKFLIPMCLSDMAGRIYGCLAAAGRLEVHFMDVRFQVVGRTCEL